MRRLIWALLVAHTTVLEISCTGIIIRNGFMYQAKPLCQIYYKPCADKSFVVVVVCVCVCGGGGGGFRSLIFSSQQLVERRSDLLLDWPSIQLKVGHHRPASETPWWCRNVECLLGSFVVFHSILEETYSFKIFRWKWGRGPHAVPRLDPHM